MRYIHALSFFSSGSIIVHSEIELEPYNTLEELSLVLYNVSVAASNAQLGGQDITNVTLVVEIEGTNYTGRFMTKTISNHVPCTLIL